MAIVIKNMLQSESIDVILLNQKDSMYNAFGYIELYVHKDNAEKAKKIITENNE